MTTEHLPSTAGDDLAIEGVLERTRDLADRLARLERVSRGLASALSVQDVGRVVVEVLDAPDSTSARALWWVDDEAGELVLAGQAGFPPSAAASFARIAFDADIPAAVAFRTGEVVASLSPSDAVDRFPALEGVPRSTESFAAVPLCLEGACVGVLALAHSGAFSADESSFVEAVAGHLAQTLARVRLAAAAEQRAAGAAAAAEGERRRRVQLEFLAGVTRSALLAADHAELMERVVTAAVPTLGDWCALCFVAADATTPEIAVAHVDPEKVAWARALTEQHPLDPRGVAGVPAVMRSGRTEFIAEVTLEALSDVVSRSGIDYATAEAILDALQLTSVITVPLLTKHGVIGAIQFVSAESGRRYEPDDVALAEGVADRVAAALENLWLTDQYRHISVTLQQALLPPALPRVPGVDVAARYWPAGAVAAVGGDFYDLFAIDADTWAVVIGDVCGTGPDAAALTGIARHTIRAAARHGCTHTEVTDWVNQAILQSGRDLFCTACYATLERYGAGWRFRSAAAGHPLPLVVRASGEAHEVGHHGTLLGVFESVDVTPGESTLGAGDTLVLYTDGFNDLPPPSALAGPELVELVRLAAERETAHDIAEALHESVRRRVPELRRRDDIALLVLRFG